MASPAFAQIGVVDHDNLHFVLDGDTFDCQTDGQILGTERGELWVYRDAGYKPVGNWTSGDPATASASEFFTAASDSLKWWLR